MQAAALAETQNSPCQAGEGRGQGLLCFVHLVKGKKKKKENALRAAPVWQGGLPLREPSILSQRGRMGSGKQKGAHRPCL